MGQEAVQEGTAGRGVDVVSKPTSTPVPGSATAPAACAHADGDVLIHAGDFSGVGDRKDVVRLAAWLDSLPHKHKVGTAWRA